MIVLVTGGARSGKSSYAEKIARHLGGEPQYCCYLATGEAFDQEMQERIAKHRASRGNTFFTVEEPVALAAACRRLPAATKVVLLDCLTTWLGNVSYRLELQTQRGGEATELEESSEWREWLEYLPQAGHHTVMVSNELGMGLVPSDKISREFRDAQGRLNQQIAAAADVVIFMVSGLPLVLKGRLPDFP
ncbi:MAG: bifunctional adenosylcobinamide kinase/adenosylcobinamide-phosphate guanylyltransferase [bacterium]|nr:bifunctional adenosylcobinamide kinase/adenosylcobinamide-phosphate guanylyltransferase [bacterium]